MSTVLKLLSSMAVKRLLAELAQDYQRQHGDVRIELTAIGGVDAAKRLAAGEAFDAVVLGADALHKLMEGGHVRAGSRVDIARSGVAVAVPAGQARPDLGSEAGVRQAVLAAPTLAYSTGPSGVALARLFERWGIAERIAARLVVPPPGVPVGSLVASGAVALGFQQLSELMHLPGIDVVGPLPAALQVETVFAGGVPAQAAQPDAARALLAFLASPAAQQARQDNGMKDAAAGPG